MSIKWMRAELKRLAGEIGADDEDVVLIMLTVVNASKEEITEKMDYPGTVGHSLSYPVHGKHQALHFPLCQMSSDDAARLAEAFILHVRKVERLRRPVPVGVMEMSPFPAANAWSFPPAPGDSQIDAHVAGQYQKIIESRTAGAPL